MLSISEMLLKAAYFAEIKENDTSYDFYLSNIFFDAGVLSRATDYFYWLYNRLEGI